MRHVLWVALVAAAACERSPSAGPDLQVVGETTRLRLEDPVPATTPWFDGKVVTLIGARGETLGIQVVHRDRDPVALRVAHPRVEVRGFDVEAFRAHAGSTAMYGETRGAGTYPDALTPASTPMSSPAYFEIEIAADATPGTYAGELRVGARRIPTTLEIVPVTLPPLARRVWAYGDPRELAWARGPTAAHAPHPSPAERACVDTFRGYGVLLAPTVRLDEWPARKAAFAGVVEVPVVISKDPARAGDDVRRWIGAMAGTGHVPFAIPIDEPRTPARRAQVAALARAVRDAGGGPGRFLFAVTDVPRAEYGDLIDLYISWNAAHRVGDHYRRWTYNGAHPSAGSMVLDAITPGTRTWGWIGWRWNIGTWYVWDALYWHDRHNRRGQPLPGRGLDPRRDPVSFDDGEDRGNLDGVLALPAPDGCQPTLRLAQLRRGLHDRQLLELAARCAPAETSRLASELVPAALADAPRTGRPAWPTTEAPWERARRRLLELASCAPNPTRAR